MSGSRAFQPQAFAMVGSFCFGQRAAMSGTMREERFASLNERDSETTLDPTLFRMYHSRLYRWLTPDPMAGDIVDPQSLNRYGYVLNNPTNVIDPLGLQWGAPAHECGIGGYAANCVRDGPFGPSYDPGVAAFYGGSGRNPGSDLVQAEAEYEHRRNVVWDMQYLIARQQQGALTEQEAQAFVSLHPDIKLTFDKLVSLDTWTIKDGELTNSLYLLYGYRIEANPLALAGRMASTVASPWAPVAWYGASASAAVGWGVVASRVRFHGPSTGADYFNGRLFGVSWGPLWLLRLDLGARGIGRPRVLHWHFFALGKGHGWEVPVH